MEFHACQKVIFRESDKVTINDIVFMRKSISTDGNCQFSAIGYLLSSDSLTIRETVILELTLFPDEYSCFIDTDVYDSFKDYVEYMEQDKTWGDNVTLVAASKAYNVNIIVYKKVQNQEYFKSEFTVNNPKLEINLLLEYHHYTALYL